MLQVELEIGADPAEVGRARRWARSRLAGSGVAVDDALAETLVLLVSELVTNAVVHAGCPAVLSLRLPRPGASGAGEGTVRVEVTDGSGRPPRRRRAAGDATHGRGLELVDGLADRWGWHREGMGKRIWCELDALRGVGAAPAAASSRTSVSGVASSDAGLAAPSGAAPGAGARAGASAAARSAVTASPSTG